MAQKKSNTVRIIGGKWRGRQLSFPSVPGLRPTPDRVRETLFNWLQQDIINAVCLDLFAGSGALGFEALSRGAKKVVMFDCSPDVVKQLKANATLLHADNAEIQQADTQKSLRTFKEKFNIIFLDPPYQSNLLADVFPLLADIVLPGALVYVETDKKIPLPSLPAQWKIIKKKRAGEVAYYLLHFS